MKWLIYILMVTVFSGVVLGFGISFSANNIETIHVEPLNDEWFVITYCDETVDDILVRVLNVTGHGKFYLSYIVENSTQCFRDHQAESIKINETAWVVAYVDYNCDTIFCSRADDWGELAIWDFTGGLQIKLENATPRLRSSYNIGATGLNYTTFFIGWTNGYNQDTKTQAYNHNRTHFQAVGSPTYVDFNAGFSSQGISLDMFNETHYVIAWFDDNEDDISYRIIKFTGTGTTQVSAITDVDTSAGANTDAVAVHTINNTAFVISWPDLGSAGFEAMRSRALSPENSLHWATTLHSLVGSTSNSVSSTYVSEDFSAYGWYSSSFTTIQAETLYNKNGTTLASGTMSILGGAFQHVASETFLSGTGICQDVTVMAYHRSSSDSRYGNFYLNLTTFNRSCDVSPPNVTLVYPVNNSLFNITLVNFSWNVSDNHTHSELCNLSLDGVLNVSNISVNLSGRTNYSIPSINTSYHFWNVSCVDIANRTGYSEQWNFTIDTVYPQVLYLDDGPLYQNSTPFQYNWSVSDAFNTSKNISCNVSVEQQTHSNIISNFTTVNSYKAFANQSGTVVSNVTCIDDAGNKNISGILASIIDLKAPQVNLLEPLNDTVYLEDDGELDILFNFSTTDNLNNLLVCNLTLDGVDNVTGIVVVTPNSTTSQSIPSIGVGLHNWSVRCRDIVPFNGGFNGTWFFEVIQTGEPPVVPPGFPLVNTTLGFGCPDTVQGQGILFIIVFLILAFLFGSLMYGAKFIGIISSVSLLVLSFTVAGCSGFIGLIVGGLALLMIIVFAVR